jgi:DNA-directed RNA polymerase sigma subunit (sigma70/sigma32)
MELVPRTIIDAATGALPAPAPEAALSRKEKRIRTDLGLALIDAVRAPGERLTLEEIAIWCDCTPQRIGEIERRALAKLRRRLRMLKLDDVEVLRAFCK